YRGDDPLRGYTQRTRDGTPLGGESEARARENDGAGAPPITRARPVEEYWLVRQRYLTAGQCRRLDASRTRSAGDAGPCDKALSDVCSRGRAFRGAWRSRGTCRP